MHMFLRMGKKIEFRERRYLLRYTCVCVYSSAATYQNIIVVLYAYLLRKVSYLRYIFCNFNTCVCINMHTVHTFIHHMTFM